MRGSSSKENFGAMTRGEGEGRQSVYCEGKSSQSQLLNLLTLEPRAFYTLSGCCPKCDTQYLLN